LIGEKRKLLAEGQTDAIDPFQTKAASRYGSRETAERQAPRSATAVWEVCVETKRPYKSFRYKANTAWSSARRGTLSASGKPNIVVGSPPEFKGEPDIWAPEELLVGSVNTCMMLTFLTLAQAKGLTPVRYESEAEGLLENVEGKYRITEVMVRPRVSLKDKAELEPAREIMETVEAQCFISNSIKSKISLTAEFVVASSPK
jgi:organic hydroperoxide reductase OsmC/OhrA